MKKISIVFVLTYLATLTAFAQQDHTEYKQAVKKMMIVSGSEKTYTVAINQMINMMKQQKSNVPNEAWDKMAIAFSGTGMNDMVDRLVPVYQKYLTLAGINEMIAFKYN